MKGGGSLAISDEYLYELQQRNEVVELIGGFVGLRHRGRTHTGLCPFHSEKSPSFVVYPETQSFYCFGCGAGGDAITFTKKINNLDYLDAVRFLAQRAGMPLPDENNEGAHLKSRVYEINKETARFYYSMLNSEQGKDARIYMRGRELSDSTIKKFGLGYSPNDYESTKKHLKSKGFTEAELIAAGVIRTGQKGGTYDFFRGRVMFPIFDIRGNVVAFGGRRMGDDGGPKYLNSSDTPVFKKSRNMFALNLAKREKSRRYILCEGYMDAIAMHQVGINTAVAPLGTAFTQEQAKLLGKYADEIVLCYDSDEAGQKATKRAISILENEPMKVSVLSMEGAKDPDEFIKKFGVERFMMLLEGTSNAIEFALHGAKSKYDTTTPNGRIGYVNEAIEILCGHCTQTERDVYAGRISEEMDITKETILAQLKSTLKNKMRKSATKRQNDLMSSGTATQINVPFSSGGKKAMGVAYSEQQLMAAAIRDEYTAKHISDSITKENFVKQEMADVFVAITEKLQKGEPTDFVNISPVLNDGARTELTQVLARNNDIVLTQEDVKMHIERVLESVPKAGSAGQMSVEELTSYMNNLMNKKT